MLDLFPTALKLAGAPSPDDRMIDGRDLSDTLFKNAPMPERPFFYYRGARLFAARLGPWKLHLLTQKGYGQAQPEAHDPPLLFNLHVDPGEIFNVATNHPSVIAEIQKAIEAHRATVTPVKMQLEEIQPQSQAQRTPAQR
jgi:arylsulfatase A